METLYILGVDISKRTFQSAITVDGTNFIEQEVENTAKTITAYFEEMKKKLVFSYSQLLVCLEHTGIYSYPLIDFLVQHQIKVCVEPALQIKRSQGMTRGKSDQVDARRIAQYAYKNRPELKYWRPQRFVIKQLRALLATRERLVKTRIQLELPIDESADFIDESIRKMMAKNCKNTLKGLEKDLVRIEAEIDQIIRADASLTEQMKWVTSVPGVGRITGLNVIIATGEFEKISEAKKFACYAGVAPFEHSSGTSVRGKTRVSKMANMTLKKLLHLAARSAVLHCAELKAFYQRKIAEGKNKMSVLNAVRNKLISRIFACIKNKRLYEKDYFHALA